MITLSTRQAALILNALPNVGPVTLRRIRDTLQQPLAGILNATKEQLLSVNGVGEVICSSLLNWKSCTNHEAEEKRLLDNGHDFVTCDDEHYPKALKEIYDSPIGLYWNGSYRIDRPCVAMVGTRDCSAYGKSIARKLARDLSLLGICVVSGLARGIDTEAHEGALEGGGPTIAILGNGMDIIYPPENKSLYTRVSQNGAVITEFPYGRRGDRQTFPMRNRIIAGISQAIIVVESDINGGSMITARFAAEQNRHVFAVPGKLDQKNSRGCHALIRDGATLVTCAEDILECLLPQIRFPFVETEIKTVRPKESAFIKDKPELSGDEFAVYNVVREKGKMFQDDITVTSRIAPARVAVALTGLEIKGYLVRNLDGSIEPV